MTDTITRCPKCKTSFKVNQAHLSTARGAVRCGSCLTIFNAKEHIQTSAQAVNSPNPKPAANKARTSNTRTTAATKPSSIAEQASLAAKNKAPTATKTDSPLHSAPAAQKPSKASTATANTQNKTETIPDEDDLLICDDMDIYDHDDTADSDSDGAFDENFLNTTANAKTEFNLFERRARDSEDDEEENNADDESWAMDLLEDDSEDEKPLSRPQAASSRSDNTKDITAVHRAITDSDLAEISQNKPKNIGRSHVFQVIEDDYNDTAFNEDELDSPFDDKSTDELHSQERSNPYTEDVVIQEPFENTHTGYIGSIEPEPLEIHYKQSSVFWQSNYLWFSLSLIAAIALVFQLGYFNFDQWSRKQQIRPYYAIACDVFDCVLPVLKDVDKIRIDNMVVIDHPRLDATLLVDATLLNAAKFQQHFPTLLLTFTNLHNKIISEHQFTPRQYVGGELAGRSLMPANHPIHITLEIPDPGSEAVNYQISVIKQKN